MVELLAGIIIFYLLGVFIILPLLAGIGYIFIEIFKWLGLMKSDEENMRDYIDNLSTQNPQEET